MCGRNFGNLLIPALAGMLTAETLTAPQPARQTFPDVIPQTACPQCQTAVSSAFDWCPHCGQALRAQVKAQTCAYCNRAMTAGAQHCPSCGAPAGKK